MDPKGRLLGRRISIAIEYKGVAFQYTNIYIVADHSRHAKSFLCFSLEILRNFLTAAKDPSATAPTSCRPNRNMDTLHYIPSNSRITIINPPRAPRDSITPSGNDKPHHQHHIHEKSLVDSVASHYWRCQLTPSIKLRSIPEQSTVYPRPLIKTDIMTELTRTLPASWYCNDSLYQMERRAVFLKVSSVPRLEPIY